MVIGADGYGYAISNDANHLIRFTTGKKAVITDLGNLVDAESNKGISIHNKCTSWGGDMIADAFNKLYIITANHYVFSVDVDSRVATLMGTITGLPAQYSTNGAAVDNDGNIVVSSANTFEGYYKFKLSDLAAVKIEGSDKTYNASDLANGNFLFQKEADARNKFNVNPALPPVEFVSTDSKVFPNPVTGNEFKVLLDGQKPGAYTIIVTDLSGKNILNRSVNYSGKAQVETVKVDRLLGKGMYFVKVTGAGNEVIFTEKIMVQ
ncbi:MAG: T9SS type A sorting domain-containing protein [Chitinophagaceae bacterium]|nr:T9SS type A sorting domain-containing protein [Chitinophagaceae bacterium]